MIRHSARRTSLLVGLITGIVALPCMAQGQAGAPQPPPSLGQSWPQMTNVSAAPGWRVYAFVRDKVKYIQVNDLVGTVRATLATADGYFLVLPLGADAQRGLPTDVIVQTAEHVFDLFARHVRQRGHRAAYRLHLARTEVLENFRRVLLTQRE